MTRLACPFCGARELQEFRFYKTLPSGEAGATAFAQVYERAGGREHGSRHGSRHSSRHSTEHWQHIAGCRAWLLVQRDPATGTVLAVELLGTLPA